MARRTPKQERSKEMVDAILDATAQVLIEEGYDRASTNKIAARAGVSIGSLYQYFENKESLVGALNTKLGENEFEIIKNQFDKIGDMPLRQAIREIVEVMVESHRLQPDLHKVLVEQVPRVGETERIRKIDSEIVALVRNQLCKYYPGTEASDLDLIVFIIFNVVETLTHQAVLYRPELLKSGELTREIACVVELYLDHKMAELI